MIIASFLFVAASSASAHDIKLKAGDPRLVDFKDLDEKSIALALMLTEEGKEADESARSSSTERRLVYVDGVLIEMAEWAIVANIRNGFFKVVYPGTNIPWERGERRHPFYPPDWTPEHF